MAITTGAGPLVQAGTQATVLTTTGSAVSDGNVSAISDSVSHVIPDNVKMVSVVGEFTFAALPGDGKSVSVAVQAIGVDGVNDSPVPDPQFFQKYIGSLPVIDSTSIQRTPPVDMPLPSYKDASEFKFVFKNNAGQDIAVGAKLLVTPIAYNTKA